MKLHLCCGDVYLADYINCDVTGILASNVPLVAKTTLQNYYADRMLGQRQAILVDRYLDLTTPPYGFAEQSIDEIVMINAIEHFDKNTARRIVAEIKRILKPGGKFLVDFPDLAETIKQYYFADPEFCMRHIYNTHKDTYATHRWGYTPQTFQNLLGLGWRIIWRDIVAHDYPVIGCEAIWMGANCENLSRTEPEAT